MLAEEGFVLPPGLDRAFIKGAVQGKKDLGWFIERMKGPIDAEPQGEKEGRNHDGTNKRR
jgi:hypothetical protein